MPIDFPPPSTPRKRPIADPLHKGDLVETPSGASAKVIMADNLKARYVVKVEGQPIKSFSRTELKALRVFSHLKKR